MKGLVVEQIGRLTLKDDLPVPQIGEYEALVKIETCMICNGTDLGVIHGKVREVPQYPVVLGHEDAGYVVKTGSRVRSFRIGDLVLRAGSQTAARMRARGVDSPSMASFMIMQPCSRTACTALRSFSASRSRSARRRCSRRMPPCSLP